MEKDAFIKNSILLILSNLITGILGFMYSIALSRELGADGMALNGLIMPINRISLCLICGGMLTALSKIIAEYKVKYQYNNIIKSMRTILTLNVIWAIFIIFILFLLINPISEFIIKDERVIYALRISCGTIFFMTLSNTFKGYFYGIANVGIPAVIDVFEKSARIFIISFIFKFYSPGSITAKVTAANITISSGEFISLVLLFLYYKVNIKKYHNRFSEQPDRTKTLIKNILVISLPLCLNEFISTIFFTVSTLLIPKRLVAGGIPYEEALTMIGKFSNMSVNIVSLPMIIIFAISIVLIPDLSQKLVIKDKEAVKKRISSVIKISFILGLSVLIICLIWGDNLGRVFYNRNDLGNYIRFAALSAPISYTAAATNSILNGLGKQKTILKNSLIAAVIEILIIFFLTAIPSINILGCGIEMIVTAVVTLIMNGIEINKFLNLKFSLTNIIIYLQLALLFFYCIKIASNIIKLISF